MRLIAFLLLLFLTCPALAELSPEATAQRLDQLYRSTDPRLGARLYDPRYVLTFGPGRGYGLHGQEDGLTHGPEEDPLASGKVEVCVLLSLFLCSSS